MWSLESHVNASEHGTWIRLEASLPSAARLSKCPLQLSCLHHHTCWVFQKAVAACILSNRLKPPTTIYFSAFLLCLKCLCMTVLLLTRTGETRLNCYLWSFWLNKYLWQKICQVFQWQVLQFMIRANSGYTLPFPWGDLFFSLSPPTPAHCWIGQRGSSWDRNIHVCCLNDITSHTIIN